MSPRVKISEEDQVDPSSPHYLGLKPDDELTDDERERLHKHLHPEWYSDPDAVSSDPQAVEEAVDDDNPDDDNPTE